MIRIALRIAVIAFRAKRRGATSGEIVRLVSHAALACEAARRGSSAARLHRGAARNVLFTIAARRDTAAALSRAEAARKAQCEGFSYAMERARSAGLLDNAGA